MSFIDSILGRNSAPAPKPQISSEPAAASKSVEIPNPLDIYAKMYEPKEGQVESEGPPSFNIDDKVLSEVSGKMNFTSTIDPALLSKAQSGDAQAMIELIQQVGQGAYKAALKHGTALTDVHLNKRGEFEKAELSKSVKNTLTNQALSEIPNASHPVVKNELRRIAESLAKQNPDASPKEIVAEAQKYFTTVYNAISSPASAQEDNSIVKAGEVQDWEKFLTT